MAYYLKYRPKKIAELDLTIVRDRLSEILAAKEIPHAFLFVGPRGTGKTSSARILAKAVNCTAKSKSGEPCNKCESCKIIGDGRSLDLIEIDAASNRGIDDIRDLRDKINLSPSKAKYKVYIIDEVHMLTNEAFNALLKTLEEPPQHAKFVLCTTEPQKLPGTIVSRCVEVKFNKAHAEEMVRALGRVVKGEGLKIKDKDVLKIVLNSDGSFRDGVKLLEQLASIGKSISSKRVAEVINQGLPAEELDRWLVMIYKKQLKEALGWLAKSIDQGLSVKQLMTEAVSRLRQVLLVKLELEDGNGLDDLDDLEQIKKMVEHLMAAAGEIKESVISSLPVELAVIEWCLNSGKEEPAESDDMEPDTASSESNLKADKKEKISENKKALNSQSGDLDIGQVSAKWNEVLEAVRPHNHSLEALLKATRPVGFEDGCLALEVFYKFHKERLEVDRYRRLVEDVISKVLVAETKVKYFLSPTTQKVVSQGKADDNISAAEVEDDIIKTAEEVFGVEVK